MKTEITFKPLSGYMLLIVAIVVPLIAAYFFMNHLPIFGGISVLLWILILIGFSIIGPNESLVLVLFGTYKGTIKDNGFFWVNPFFLRKKISLKARNLNGTPLKVNDKIGNPIEIAAVIVWQVRDTFKAAFEVDNYTQYVQIQSEASVRHLAGICPYDNFEEETAEITLRGGSLKVNAMLEEELNERLSPAGIMVMEARISHLAYAPEIAGAMLQRQQATAVVAARKQIVEGAVGMVELALNKLKANAVIELDEERKAAMVSNLLVVLCGDKNVNPVINAGTLHN
ncbi:MAG: SPFH domain-containing protein [Bacteroidia bacterium]|nr:SPFH domain-containing protein [Bacteroidia bacterium]